MKIEVMNLKKWKFRLPVLLFVFYLLFELGVFFEVIYPSFHSGATISTILFIIFNFALFAIEELQALPPAAGILIQSSLWLLIGFVIGYSVDKIIQRS